MTPSAPAAARRRRFGWRAGLGAALVALIAVLALGSALRAHAMSSALLRTDPDAIPADGRLVAYAASVAEPAYAARCASCHGAHMQGDPDRGVPNLADKDWLYGTGRVSDIEQTILYGVRSGDPKARNLAVMPAFGHANPSPSYKIAPLTPGEIHDVAQYLLFIEDRPADPAAVARGVKIFSNTGGCYDCHANDGQGDTAIGAPNLVDHIWLYGDGSAADIERSITRGHEGICPAWVGRLSLATIRALAVYIHTISSEPNKGAAA